MGHVDEIVNDPEYELLFFYCSSYQNVFLCLALFKFLTIYIFLVGYSYKFDFPTPEDRPGAPIISFR